MFRRLLNIVSALWIAVAEILLRLGLIKQRDPWRYNAAINLRSESGKMMGGMFSVKSCADDWTRDPAEARARFAKRLRDFLAREAIARQAAQDTRYFTRIIPVAAADVFVAEFASDGGLARLVPVLDPEIETGLDSAGRERVHDEIVKAANATLAFDVTERARKILESMRRSHSADEMEYAQRILQGSFVAFEGNADRFTPPEPLVYRFPGAGMLNFVVRELPGGAADIWIQCQHAALDGVEFDEWGKRLEQNFGGCGETLFPRADGTARHTLRCPSTSGRELAMISDFFDFGPLRRLRRNLNRNFAGNVPIPITDAMLLLWSLGIQPEFAGETFALTVDVPPDEGHPRRLDFLVMRPRLFYNPGASLAGLPAFLAAYGDRFRLVRARRSRTYRTMRRIALLPPSLAHMLTAANARGRQRGFGSIKISFLNAVTVSLAPISIVAGDRGTISIGSMLLPCEGGGTVGWVTMRGEPSTIAPYPGALERALSTFPDALRNYI